MNATNTTASVLSPSFVGHSLSHVARAVFATIGGVMIVCGVAGNGLLITVIFGPFRKKRVFHDLFLANLASADTVTLGYWLTFFVLDMILGYHPVVNETHCQMNGMIIYTTMAVSILSLLAISINRYLHVCHSQLFQCLFTWTRTVVICIGIWTVSILLALPPLFGIDEGVYLYSAPTHECSFDPPTLTYVEIVVIPFTTIPMLVIGYCNYAIFRFWRRANAALYGWKYRNSMRTLFGRRKKTNAKRSQETESAAGQESVEEADRGHHEDGKRRPVTDSEEDISRTGGSTSNDLEDGQTANTAWDIDRSGIEVDSASQTDHPSTQDGNAKKEWCVTTNLSTASVEFYLPKQVEEEEDHGDVEELCDCSHAAPVPVQESEPSRKMPSLDNRKTTPQVDTLMVPATKTPETLSPSPSQSSVTSRRKTPSGSNPQKYPMTVSSTLQRPRKKRSAKEVAFVRSLFVVFLLACLAFTPFGVITVVRSFVTVPAEVRIMGMLLLLANSSVNWVVYGVMNPSFRSAYRKCGGRLFGKCCPGKQQ